MRIFRKLFGRRAVPLTAETPDGTYVEVTGVARALPDQETVVPPISEKVCVVARIRYVIPVTGPDANTRQKPTTIERFHNRPFELETKDLDVIVDSEFLQIDVVEREAATVEEESIPIGARIAVRGTLRRDVDRPDGDVMFRETQYRYTLTGSEEEPVEITASVSDDDGS